MIKVAVFASGNGSNAEALMKRAQELSRVEIALILCDQPGAGVIERAQKYQVPAEVVPRQGDKKSHEEDILSLMKKYQIEWIFLAGYMRLLSAGFLKSFSEISDVQRVVNIHPSLLPAYPGKDSIARAFADQVSESGVTLHYVDEGMDTGQVIQQRTLALNKEDILPEWKERMHALEHQMYMDFLTSLEEL